MIVGTMSIQSFAHELFNIASTEETLLLFASEILKHIVEMFLRYYMHSDIITRQHSKRDKSSNIQGNIYPNHTPISRRFGKLGG